MPGSLFRILIIEDNPGDVRLIREMLSETAGLSLDLVSTDRLSAGMDHLLRRPPFDLLILDLGLPDSQGLETLKMVAHAFPALPILVLTGLADEETGLRALKEGAQDYLIKGQVEAALLFRSIRYAMERKKIQMALERSEERYRNIVEDQTELISRFLPDGTHVFANTAYCRYFGKRREEIIGHRFVPRLYREDRQRIARHLASLTREHPVATIEHRIVMPGGSIRWQQWSDRAVFDAGGHLTEYQSVGRDITERKQAEEALLESEKKFRELFHNANDPILLSEDPGGDLSGPYREVNDVACRLYGYSRDEFMGMTQFELTAPKDRERIPSLLRKIRALGDARYETLHRTKNGLEFPVEVSAHLFSLGGKQVILSLIRDITERKIQEEVERKAFEQIEKNITQFAILGDHIRNPLSVIVGYADLDESALGEKIIGQAEIIDGIITKLDKGWINSDKVREILRKRYRIGAGEEEDTTGPGSERTML